MYSSDIIVEDYFDRGCRVIKVYASEKDYWLIKLIFKSLGDRTVFKPEGDIYFEYELGKWKLVFGEERFFIFSRINKSLLFDEKYQEIYDRWIELLTEEVLTQ